MTEQVQDELAKELAELLQYKQEIMEKKDQEVERVYEKYVTNVASHIIFISVAIFAITMSFFIFTLGVQQFCINFPIAISILLSAGYASIIQTRYEKALKQVYQTYDIKALEQEIHILTKNLEYEMKKSRIIKEKHHNIIANTSSIQKQKILSIKKDTN